MYIRNSYYALAFRISGLSICLAGIFRHLSLSNLKHNEHMFSFFTIQSNLLCGVLFLFLTWDTLAEIHGSAVYPLRYQHRSLRGICLSSIFVTFLIFQFVLKRKHFSMYSGVTGIISENDLYVHYLVPFLTMTDWLLFEPKGQWNWYQPLYWLWMPFFYFNSTMIRGLYRTGTYPYFFLDIETSGIAKFIFYSFILLLIYLFLGYLLVLTDQFLFHIMTDRKPQK